ncbi:MaoC family dehydratase [Rhodoblastus acidophilus]|uniref:MaoC family dehydratase n=2 Tax=Rhodoblastus acidophilus TaxID=1074 RepID=UPI002225CCE2|nr:MaoC family dehydratase [Rhodoblastus acidophilus]
MMLLRGDKLPTLEVGPFTHAELASYAAASGDSNPLHLDATVARQYGFSACPVHGMRLLAVFEQMLRDWREGLIILSLKGQFLTPVLEGERATLSGRVAKVEKSSAGIVGVVRLMAYTHQGAPALVGETRVQQLAPCAGKENSPWSWL